MLIKEHSRDAAVEVYGIYWAKYQGKMQRFYLVIPYEGYEGLSVHRTGRYDQWTSRYGNAGAIAKAEYEATKKLINNQRAYGISDVEHAVNQSRVEEFGRQLDDMGIPRD